MDEQAISEMLEMLSDAAQQRKMSKQVNCLRGIRGTPLSEVARIGAAIQAETPPSLPEDEDALTRLFGTAWEDGLVAIGLLAALVPEHPADVFEIGQEWLTRVDDVQTADALGWLVLGPSALATGRSLAPEGRPEQRRAVAAMALSMIPLTLEGPSAAPLRQRLDLKAVQFVLAPVTEPLGALLTSVVKDSDPGVRKVIRRVLRAWTKADPGAVVAWAETIRGGLPRLLQDEVNKARRKA